MAEDWDLFAIVRSCTSPRDNNTDTPNNVTNTNTHASSENDDFFDCLANLTFENQQDLFSFPDLAHPRNNGLQELQNSYLPFLPSTNNHPNVPVSSISDFGAFTEQNQFQLLQQQLLQQLLPPPPPAISAPPPTTNAPFSFRFNNSQLQPSQPQQPHHQNQRQQLHHQVSHRPEPRTKVVPSRNTPPAASRSRKKKSNQKRQVMYIAAENLCNDVWAWRKYGQKPIKGSPYPRNYYRCSSSKGCVARKQVERCHTDPNMFIVSYTGDHTHPRPTHRNSLAGSTRNKIPTNQKPANKESEDPTPEKAPCTSPISGTNLSPSTPLSASMDHEAAADDSIKADAENMDGADVEGQESDVVGDGEDYDEILNGDNILIPNKALIDEDLIKDLQELGSVGDGAFVVGNRSSRSPDFGDNFSDWLIGNPAAAAGSTVGGGGY